MKKLLFLFLATLVIWGCNSTQAFSQISYEHFSGKWSSPCYADMEAPEQLECSDFTGASIQFAWSENQLSGREISQSAMAPKKSTPFQIEIRDNSTFMIFDYGKDGLRSYEIVLLSEEVLRLKNEKGTYFKVYQKIKE